MINVMKMNLHLLIACTGNYNYFSPVPIYVHLLMMSVIYNQHETPVNN